MKRILAGTFIGLGFLSHASAADLGARPYTKAPVLGPVYNWTGFYVGAGGGYGSYVSQQSTLLLSGLPDANRGSNGGGQGGFGTVVAGYDLQFADRFVAGLFADYDFSDVQGRNLNFSNASIPSRGLDSAWSVGGRLGFLVSPATLLYATGGYTHGEFRGGAADFIRPPTVNGSETGTSQGGAFAGVGVETMFWNNVSGRIEYRYASYDSATGTRFNVLNAPAGLSAIQPDVQTIRATLAYKFGTPGIGATYSAPVQPAFSWTGFYLGGGIGYGTYAMDSQNISPFQPTLQPWTNGGKGALGTLVAGYDVQFAGRWVAGIFGDYDFASADGTSQMYAPAHDEFHVGQIKQKSAWAVGGRLGFLVTPQTLTYATAGYTEAEFEGATFTNANAFGNNFTPIRPGQTFSGWFAGIGAESQLTSNWYARLEYRYAEYDAAQSLTPIPPTAAVELISFKPTIQTVRAGVTYKFGGPGVANY